MNTTIKKPIQTEKSLLSAKNGRYTFAVATTSSKPAIKKALEESFGVKIKSISTTMRKGKVKTVGRSRKSKKLADQKFAQITLKSGKIDIFTTE